MYSGFMRSDMTPKTFNQSKHLCKTCSEKKQNDIMNQCFVNINLSDLQRHGTMCHQDCCFVVVNELQGGREIMTLYAVVMQ